MVLVNPPAAAIGERNVLLWGRGARHYHVRDFPGSLSIKSVVRGEAVWETAEGRFPASEDSYLILNHGQRYTITVDAPEPAETFCPFFARGFVEEVGRSVSSPSARLLDDPFAPTTATGFFETLRPHDGDVTPELVRLREALVRGEATPLGLEERFLLLARALVEAESGLGRQAARLPAARASTRAEVFRRLRRARDFVEGGLDGKLSLESVARAACLSPYHFHRLFVAAFGETPHGYVVRRRLERARHLLARTERPVTEVCLDAGFCSLGSFSALFRRRFGLSPRQFRAAQKSKIGEERRPVLRDDWRETQKEPEHER